MLTDAVVTPGLAAAIPVERVKAARAGKRRLASFMEDLLF
tara:strand:- start:60578 stop:60697 length:120 start_codon:yes stop_codon:yes gene_type:complete